MKYLFEVIAYERTINALMRAADVFEQGKALGEYMEMVMTVDPPITGEQAFEGMVKTLTHDESPYIVSWIYLDENNYWWNKEVRIISNGEKWGMFHKFITIKYPKLKVETDQYMYVTSVCRDPNIH